MSPQHNKLKLSGIKIQPAREEHVEDIFNILTPYFRVGKLLPRDKNNISENLYSDHYDIQAHPSTLKSNNVTANSELHMSGQHNFFVASCVNEYVGGVAVRDYGRGLFEIRSLAVSANASGKGVGSALILFAIEVVKNERKGQKVFALTRRHNVFTRLGFEVVPMEMFPKKIWFDCSKCKKLDDCDEVAVLYQL